MWGLEDLKVCGPKVCGPRVFGPTPLPYLDNIAILQLDVSNKNY
jgi:hypothetical protein